MTPHEQMIISALRYALGRRSYIMSDTEDYIIEMLNQRVDIRAKKKPDKVSENFIQVCIQDIKDHYKDLDRYKETYGVEKYDLRKQGMHDWTGLLDKLKTYEKENHTTSY